jgi:four helix bundle protein
MRDYKKYEVWKNAHELVLIVYSELAPGFPGSELFGLTDLMKKAAYSIPLHFIEGCAGSTEREFVRFLYRSLGSARELEYCFLLARDLSLIDLDLHVLLNEKLIGIKFKLAGLINQLEKPES